MKFIQHLTTRHALFSRSKLILLLICLSGYLSMTYAATIQTADNRIISYTDTGQGQPIVLIHAFPSDQNLWQAQQTSLQKMFRIITFDLWGFGQSSPVNGQAISMVEYADELKLLLDELQIDKAIIGGESMGGYIALAFLNQYPDKTKGLILADTQSIADSIEAKEKRETTAIDLLEHGTGNYINTFMVKALSPEADEETKNNLRQILEKQSATAMASALRGMANRMDTSALLASSSLPILIITGEQDVLISPQQSNKMHELAQNSKLVTISNAGHLSNLEQPEQWNQAIIDMFYQKITN